MTEMVPPPRMAVCGTDSIDRRNGVVAVVLLLSDGEGESVGGKCQTSFQHFGSRDGIFFELTV